LTKHFKIGLTLLVCMCQLAFFAQQREIDSLIKLIRADKADTNKVFHLIFLSSKLKNTNPDTAIIVGEQALKLSSSLSTSTDSLMANTAKRYMSRSCTEIGIYHAVKADYPNALKYFIEGLKIDEEIKNEHGIAKQLANIGSVYRVQGNNPKALEYYLRVSKIADKLGNKRIKANTFLQLGNIYLATKGPDTAIVYYLKAGKLAEEIGHKPIQSGAVANIGTAYMDMGDSAMKKGNRSLAINEKYPKAIEYYFKSLEIDESLGNKNGVGNMLQCIGSTYMALGNYKEAHKYLYRSLALNSETGARDWLNLTYNRLSTLYERSPIPLPDSAVGKILNKEQMRSKALYYYKKNIALRDLIFSEESKKELLRKEISYDFEKKKAVADAEHKKELGHQQDLAEEKSRKQRLVIAFVIIGLVLVLVFAGFIFRSLRLTRKQKNIIEIKNKETEEQKKVIEEKNKDITDSINYAKRIQQAKLPKRDDISASLPQSFILFKPKDIVSGDFYFFHKNTNTTSFIAAADCTGHGVPGAFMSLIGLEKLNDAVAMHKQPSEVLKQLNKGVKASLRQSDSSESTKDGMDIALCLVDTQTCTVNYSGANRPIWIIRKEKNEVEEIKATKTAIGGFTDDDQNFALHELKLQPGDTFYICTDGYADQFSSLDKKLTTKKFKQLLLEIRDRSMQEQEKHLNTFIENWRSKTEQVDDILVIGIRF
jgi:serine phosphatase RsbU (regulator of sigma subunit)